MVRIREARGDYCQKQKNFLWDWVLSPDLTKSGRLLVSPLYGAETQCHFSLGWCREAGREVPRDEGEERLLGLKSVR